MKVKVYVIIDQESGKLTYDVYNETQDQFDLEFMKSECDDYFQQVVEEILTDEEHATDTILRCIRDLHYGKYLQLICQKCGKYYGKIADQTPSMRKDRFYCDCCEKEISGK